MQLKVRKRVPVLSFLKAQTMVKKKKIAKTTSTDCIQVTRVTAKRGLEYAICSLTDAEFNSIFLWHKGKEISRQTVFMEGKYLILQL